MRKLLLCLAAALAARGAAAHPMGNFSVNRYARIEPGPTRLRIVYLVDFAEIPTFQEISAFPELTGLGEPAALDAAPATQALCARLARAWISGLSVRDDARGLPLRLRSRELRFSPGAAGLPTMKLSLVLEAAWREETAASIRYADDNAPDRLGWREIVLRPSRRVGISGADVGATDRSDGLTRYPADPTADVPQAVRARFRVDGLTGMPDRSSPPFASRPAAPPATSPAASAPASPTLAPRPAPRPADRLADLVSTRRLTPALVLLSLAIAFALGGLHALSPGHGKTVVAAYLVGSRGTARHALLLGAVVTASHTAGVFALGLVTLALSRAIVPENLYPPIELLSGVAILGTGLAMFRRRLRTGRTAAHGHSHAVDVPEGAPTVAALLALGVSGGILPCPSALVVLLSAIALHRIGFGLLLIVGFSAGLASVLSGIGVLVVRAGAILGRFESAGRWARRLPAFSALLVGILGAALAARAFPGVRHILLSR